MTDGGNDISTRQMQIELPEIVTPADMSVVEEKYTGKEVDAQVVEQYMQTPCNHKFHTVCLKKWLTIKLQCPTCRNEVPYPYSDDEIEDD
jgi:hypothetical protein